jgi:flavin-dependent dehydrogenase
MKSESDLTILGGGLAGLSLALQCRQQIPDAKITVLEKRQHPVPEAAFKVGESTVEVAAHYFGRVLGLRDHILDRQLPKLGLRFFFPAGDNSRIEDRLELGGKRYAPCPSYQLDRGRFENHLADQCLEQGVQFIDQATITKIDMGKRGAAHRVTYEIDRESHETTARWVVDASGRRAFLKRQLDMQMPSSHVGNAAWFRFSKHIKIDDWSDNSAWQEGHVDKTGRWYSTNHLMGKGYWVWLIPLASGSTSMGIVAAEEFHSLSDFNSLEKATAWLEKHEPQCADAVKANLDNIQDFRAIKHYGTECKQVFSGNRWGITGEAGFFHDPFYSPGSDFIAFSNTFLTDLIQRDLSGKGFRIRAFSYDRIFKRFYYGTKTAYQDQYRMFGNPTVMPVKILWDYMVYWSITAFVFMQGRMCHPTMYMRNLSKLTQLGKVNHFMQDFFRQWHATTAGQDLRGSVDISQIALIREMNSRLVEEMDTGTFFRRFADNLRQLETLGCEIVEQSGLSLRPPFRPSSRDTIRRNTFSTVFNPTLQQAAEASGSPFTNARELPQPSAG